MPAIMPLFVGIVWNINACKNVLEQGGKLLLHFSVFSCCTRSYVNVSLVFYVSVYDLLGFLKFHVQHADFPKLLFY